MEILPDLQSLNIGGVVEGKKVLPPLDPALPEGRVIIKDPTLPRPKEPVFPEPVQEELPVSQLVPGPAPRPVPHSPLGDGGSLESVGGPDTAQMPVSPGGLDDLVQPEHILPPKIEPLVLPSPETPPVKPAPPNLLDEPVEKPLPTESARPPAPGPVPHSLLGDGGGLNGEGGSPERLVELARDFFLTPLPKESGDEDAETLVMKDTDMPWLEKLFYPENEPKPLFPTKKIPPPSEEIQPQ